MKSNLKKSLLLALLAASTGLSAQAGTLTFGTTGTGVNGSSTTWDAGSTADWYNGATAVVWTDNSDAIFGGTAGTVTVAPGNRIANSLTFNTNGYILNSTASNNGGIAIASGGSVTVASGVTATINSYFYTIGTGGVTAAAPINLTKAGSGTLVLAGVGINGTTPTGSHNDNRPAGQIAVTGGALQLGNGTGWGGYFDNSSFTLSNGSTVIFDYDNNGGNSPNPLVNVRGTGNVVFEGYKDGYFSEGANLESTISFVLTNTGTTTLSLDTSGQTAPLWYYGSVFLQGGGSALSATSVLNMVSGNVIMRQGQTLTGLTGTGGYITADSGAQTLTLNTAASTTTSSAVVIGATNLGGSNTENLVVTGTGTQVLTGAVTYTGTTTISGGSALQIGSNTTSTAVSTYHSATTVNTGSTFILDGLGSVNLNGADTLTGAGNLQIGTGTASFATGFVGPNFASNNITGTTTINIAGNAAGTGSAWPNGEVFINSSNSLSATSLLNMVNGRIDLRTGSALTTVAGITGTNSATLISSDASWGGTQNLTDALTTGTQTYAGAMTNTAPASGATGVLLSFTKTGAGTQVLTGAVSYTGATAVNGGTLQLGATTDTTSSAINTFNSAVTIASGSTFVLDGGAANATLGGGVSLTGAGNLQVGTGSTSFAAGFLGLNEASNNITGTTTINIKSGATWPSGQVFIGANSLSASSLLNMASGSIDLRASTAVAGITGTNAAAQIASDRGVPTVTDTLTDNVATGSVSYAGSLIDLAPGSVVGGVGLSKVAFTKTGAGTQVLTGNVAYTGATAINTGTLQLGATTDTTTSAINNFASAVTIASGATLLLDGGAANSTLGAGASLTGAGNLQIGSGTTSFAGAFTGLNESSNTITGTTTVNLKNAGTWPNGAVFIDNANSLSATSLLNMVNGTLDFRSGTSVAGISGSNAATVLGSDGFAPYQPVLTDNVSTGTVTYAGQMVNQLTGSGNGGAVFSLLKTGAGTQVLSGSVAIAGTTTVNGGTLVESGTTSSSGSTVVNNGATLLVTGQAGATGTTSVNGGATVLLEGPGAITQSTINVTGTSLASVATLKGDGTIGAASGTNAASLTVGQFGVLAVGDASEGVNANNLTLNSTVPVNMTNGSTLSFILNGSNTDGFSGVTNNNASVLDFSTGQTAGTVGLTLTGTVNLQLVLNYTPVIGDMYQLTNFNESGTTGTFGEVNGVLTNLSEGATFNLDGEQYTITYQGGLLASDIVLTANGPAVVPEPSEYALLLVGLAALGLKLRRSRFNKSAV